MKTPNKTKSLGKAAVATKAPAKAAPVAKAKNLTAKPAAKKLSFKEQREYDSLPVLIEQLEAEQAHLNEALADGRLYVSDPQGAAVKAARVVQIDDELLNAMERWEQLSQRAPAA